MTYKVEPTRQSRWALVAPDGRTVHLFHSEHAAITACDAMNRANEPVRQIFSDSGCGRWDRREVAA